jgi:Mob1/phocein family
MAAAKSFLGSMYVPASNASNPCNRNPRTRSATSKPKKAVNVVNENSKASHLRRYATSVLGSGNLRQAVLLPDGEDLNEWLAVNSI